MMKSTSAILLILLLSETSNITSASNVRGSASRRELGVFDEDQTPTGNGTDINLNLNPDDTPLVAEALGISLADAHDLMEEQKIFSKLIDVLQDDEDFLQAEMPKAQGGEFIIKYKNGKIPKSNKELIEGLKAKNPNMKVKSEATKFSLKDAEARGDRLARKLESKGYSNVGFAIDGDAIEVTAKKSSKHKKDKKENDNGGHVSKKRAAEILDLSEEDDDAFGLELGLFEFEDEDTEQLHHTYGGRLIDGAWGGCTTGFTVWNIYTGETGVATAG